MHELLYDKEQFFTEFGKINGLKAITTLNN
jgi:hypothetical protein